MQTTATTNEKSTVDEFNSDEKIVKSMVWKSTVVRLCYIGFMNDSHDNIKDNHVDIIKGEVQNGGPVPTVCKYPSDTPYGDVFNQRVVLAEVSSE